jgi:hypothetical protein
MEPISADRLATAARDAAYVSVGLGVIAFQRLQVRRHELSKTVAERVKLVEERLGSTIGR